MSEYIIWRWETSEQREVELRSHSFEKSLPLIDFCLKQKVMFCQHNERSHKNWELLL